MSNLQKVEDAKKVLEQQGYFVYNLWCEEDVQQKFPCAPDTAQRILLDTMMNDSTMNHIWETMEQIIKDKYRKNV